MLQNILLNAYKKEMISFMDSHPECFNGLIKLSISDNPSYAKRAAWLAWSCMEKNDPRVKQYIKPIIIKLVACKDDHKRELLKILLQMELSEEDEGYIFEICMGIWENVNKKPSIRFTAFCFIIEIVKKFPGLLPEATHLTREQYLESLSHAVRKSIERMISTVRKSSA